MTRSRAELSPTKSCPPSVTPERRGSVPVGVFSSDILLSPPSMQDWSVFFLKQLPLIERIVRSVCGGRRMGRAEIEEFEAVVKLRLIENDYAVLQKFEGRSAFGTFITTVVSRLLKDYRDHEWGKWRNSAEAKRLGALAMELERMLLRDQRTLHEAFIELAPNYPGITRSSLEQLAERFPKRHRRRLVSLDERPDVVADPDGEIETAQTAALISSIVRPFIARLPEQDQLLLQLRFEGDLPVPQIARSLHLDMQLVYRKLRGHFQDLRVELEKAGIDARDVAKLSGTDGALLDFRFKTVVPRPSNEEGGPEDESEVAPEEGA